MIYGYARVSSNDQNLRRQLDALKEYGIKNHCIFTDKKSGKDFDRTNYLKLTGKLQTGDLLVIKSIDRLGRNYQAIIDEWRLITQDIGADIVVLDMPLLDTRAKNDSLTRKLICDIVLQVLSFVAENERLNIKERQKEGITAAKKRGVKFGRPATIYTNKFVKVMKNFKNKEISACEAVRLLSISRGSLYFHMEKLTKLGKI